MENGKTDTGKSPDQAFDMSIILEEEAIRFYSLASRYAIEPETRDLFNLLKTAEKQHLNELVLRANKPILIAKEIIQEAESDEFTYYELVSKTRELDQKSALLLGIRDENKAIRFYSQALKTMENKRTIAMFNQFIKDESEHTNQLVELYVKLFGMKPRDEDFIGLPAATIPT